MTSTEALLELKPGKLYKALTAFNLFKLVGGQLCQFTHKATRINVNDYFMVVSGLHTPVDDYLRADFKTYKPTADGVILLYKENLYMPASGFFVYPNEYFKKI